MVFNNVEVVVDGSSLEQRKAVTDESGGLDLPIVKCGSVNRKNAIARNADDVATN